MAQQRGEKGARSTQTVDAQCIVRTVLVGPLGMTDKSWRQRVEVEVAHAVTAYNHCRALLSERIHYLLQRCGRRVEVVAVELYGETSATRIVHSHVPASSNAQSCAFWHYMNEPFVGVSIEEFGCLVGGEVIHNDNIILEVSLLRQRAINRVAYRFLAVAHGNNH